MYNIDKVFSLMDHDLSKNFFNVPFLDFYEKKISKDEPKMRKSIIMLYRRLSQQGKPEKKHLPFKQKKHFSLPTDALTYVQETFLFDEQF